MRSFGVVVIGGVVGGKVRGSNLDPSIICTFDFFLVACLFEVRLVGWAACGVGRPRGRASLIPADTCLYMAHGWGRGPGPPEVARPAIT